MQYRRQVWIFVHIQIIDLHHRLQWNPSYRKLPLAIHSHHPSRECLIRSNEIFFSRSLYRKSQYRVDYEGIDTKLHRREPPVVPKDKQLSYVVPYQKMDTMTVTQVDYNE